MLSAETSLQTKFSDIIHDDSELAKLVILLLSLLTSYIQAGGLGRCKQLFVAYFERNKKVVCRSY